MGTQKFLGNGFGKRFWEIDNKLQGRFTMRKKNFKGRCEKRSVSKCKDVCRTYDPIQFHYVNILQAREDVQEIRLNVDIEEHTTDFVCVKCNGDIFVRECVYRKHITKPMTVKLLDMSREYWLNRGVTDWGVVTNE